MEELTPIPTNPPKISVYITTQDIIQGYKVWKESTLTSPSGMCLNLYKIWLTHEKSDDLMSLVEFFSIYAKLCNKALSIGYPLSRSKFIHNMFILKE
eukprot:5177836-Ditylum_brightwellii.AAC.1